ncbi:glycosyltransferase family 9 protein [Pseudohongiella spirulinae]|uniref:Uncharacterized protein n=1 Tax=Pseudohongiella spirulinae TaxID=1249552 RepID=A0A0S2KCP1_9GAMM|nr:glycosyltransferase family 9 protein [Pseudohongiella spirulinae]ALO46075.1 hypothetical protein PS2015_1418 [Pseudohongiella spirulinae]
MTHSVSYFDSATSSRIALINPTKYLGNLLLAGQFIQTLSEWCENNNAQLLLVVDQQFQSLLAMVPLSGNTQLIFYPRAALQNGSILSRVQKWFACVWSIRNFQADLAFHLEEDSVSVRLTRLSGAKRKVNSAASRSGSGFDVRLQVERAQRPAGERSIWYVFREIFEKLQLPVPSDHAYISFGVKPRADLSKLPSVLSAPLADPRPKVVVHAGAGKLYKKWPVSHYSDLCRDLLDGGFIVFLIGHGADDEETNSSIISNLPDSADCYNLSGQFDLSRLAGLIVQCQLMVGNDSGPSHLGSALGVPGVVIFGPTEIEIWRPLGKKTRVLSNKTVCRPDCSRHHCAIGYGCLRGISPRKVYTELVDLYGNR